MNWLWMGIYHAAAMFWETLWALVLGFGISAALQVFVSKERMTQLLARRFARDLIRHRVRCGELFMLLRGGLDRPERVPKRRGSGAGARVHVCFNQSGH